MAKSPNKKAEGKASSGNVLTWVIALVIGVVALPTAMLLTVGMAPTLVALFIIDRHPSKYASRAVGYLNFAGCLPYAIDLWRTGNVWDFETLTGIITDPLTLLVMYSCAAVGWMILFATPPVVAAYLSVTSEMRETALKERQKELISQWGRNVRLGAMGAEMEDGDEEDASEDEDDVAATETAPSS